MAAILIQTTAAISPASTLVKVCVCFVSLSPFSIPAGIMTSLDSANYELKQVFVITEGKEIDAG